MPWALFSVGILLGVAALNSHFALRRVGLLVLPAWLTAWLVSELPVHFMVLSGGSAALLSSLGGAEGWQGFVGLGLCVAAALAMLPHVSAARRARGAVEAALARGLGSDYREQQPEHAELSWRYASVLPIRQAGVERVRNITYHTARGKELRLDVFRPTERADKHPVALYVHGGGWVIGNKNQQGLMTMNALASRGWVCVSINYRLSPRATFPEHLHDVKRAIKWVRENIANHGGDPDFVVICGGSAGAHLSALAALTPNDREFQVDFPEVDTRVQGCVGYYGVYDFCDRHGHWPHRLFRAVLLERVVMKRRFADSEELFRNASPAHRVSADAPPFFLIHGDRDSLAPVHESRSFSAELAEVSEHPVVYAEIPGANHAFEIFPSVRSAAVIDGVVRFCDYIYARHQAARSSTDEATTST